MIIILIPQIKFFSGMVININTFTILGNFIIAIILMKKITIISTQINFTISKHNQD